MSISQTLSNATSGLAAQSRLAEILAANIANAATDGYGRRSVALVALSGVSGGVGVAGIIRQENPALLSDRRLADSQRAAGQATQTMLARVEQVLGDATAPGSLAARITALEGALISAAADPASDLRLSDTLGHLHLVAGSLRTAGADINRLRQEAEESIAAQVSALNTALVQTAELNSEIARATVRGQDPSALKDQRQVVVDRIAAIVPLREFPRADGQIALYSAEGQTLLDGRPSQFGFAASTAMEPVLRVEEGTLGGLMRDGQPLGGRPVGRLGGGSLGAAFALRDQVLPAAQDRLDQVAQDLVLRFQDPATDPSRPAPGPGLLTDHGGAHDPDAVRGLASRVMVNAAVDPAQGGALFRLRAGLGATAPGPAGDGTQIARLGAALAEGRPLGNGGPPRGAAGHAGAMIAAAGLDRATADSELGFAQARWQALREQELGAGVDTDHEMQVLLKVEEAYAANARVMRVVDEMMQRLMEI